LAFATGAAGASNNNGNGGRGGAALGAGGTATSTSATSGHAYGYARQVGGAGGSGFGAGHAGGAGGLATTTTAKASGYSACARVVQTGGAGGYGAGGANGGAGAASTLTINTVSGATRGGAASYLKLYQFATGGKGGGSSSARGGVGGAATSNLTFNDLTANTSHAASVTGTAGAYGGAGGSSRVTGGRGGAATASLTLTGASSVSVTTDAIGGAGGTGAVGGNASATSHATGTASISSNASAIGGTGGAGAGTALAIATGKGGSGALHSNASANLAHTLVTAVQSQAQAPVNGTGTAVTWAAIGKGAVPAPVMLTDQAVALLTAEPKSTDVNSILSSNANIKTAFTVPLSPIYFGIGELGGAYAYSTNDTASETETSSVHMTVDLTKVAHLHDLLIGFYSGTAAGSGFASMSLDVKINGTDHITDFATVAAANAFFQNHAVDYGALSALGTSTLQLDISLSITEAAAGSYNFGMLIGDPLPASSHPSAASGGGWGAGDAAAHLNMVDAISSFGAGAGDWSGPFTSAQPNDHHAMLAAHSA
jgi:hypothetical protein